MCDGYTLSNTIVQNSSKLDLNNLLNILKKSWCQNDKVKIQRISESSFSNYVAQIKMKESFTPPIMRGYPRNLLKFGWGYYHYNNHSLFLTPIYYQNTDFYYKKLNNQVTIDDEVFSINIKSKIKSNKEEIKKNIKNIKEMINKEWDKNTIKNIKYIKPVEDDNKIYKIRMKSNVKSIDDLKNRTISDLDKNRPTVPTKKYISTLVSNGWGVIGIERNKLYIAKIQRHISSDEQIYDFDVNTEITTFRPNI